MLHGQNSPKNCPVVSVRETPPSVAAGWGSAGSAAFRLVCLFTEIFPCSYQKLWLLLEPLVGPGDGTQWPVLAFQPVYGF